MIIDLICFSAHGSKLAEELKNILNGLGHYCNVAHCFGPNKVDLKAWTTDAFETADALIFVGAAGIAVRSVAPHVSSKIYDPAVLVCDDTGRFVIPLLSGHIGGANELASCISQHMGAISVVTTATDNMGVFAIDSWAKKQGLEFANPSKIKSVSARLLMGDKLTLKSQFPIDGPVPKEIEIVDDKEYDVYISVRTRGRESALRLVPKVCVIGIDTASQASAADIDAAVDAALKKGSVSPLSIKCAASIRNKQNEQGILDYCRKNKLPFEVFSARELESVQFRGCASSFNKSTCGVSNVSERSALLSCEGGTIVTTKVSNGISVSIAMQEPKLSF